jgi:hypothetical protein
VRAGDLRLCQSGGHGVMDLRNCAIHANGPVADALDSSLRVCSPGSAIEPFRAVRGISGQELLVAFQRARDTATDPITLRETPAQHARTSFRHPQAMWKVPQVSRGRSDDCLSGLRRERRREEVRTRH